MWICLLFFIGMLEGYTQGYPAGSTQNPWDTIRHQLNNQEIEIRSFEHRLENLQVILDHMREQMQSHSSSTTLELKMGALENIAKSLAADLQQLKSHANETTNVLQGYKKMLQEHEQRFSHHAQNIEHLSGALSVVLDKEIATSEEKLYKIKSGDRLDKIAKTYGTTVKELMRINNLTSDKIVEGKTLKVP